MLSRKLVPATARKHWLTVLGTQQTSNIQNFANSKCLALHQLLPLPQQGITTDEAHMYSNINTSKAFFWWFVFFFQ